MVVEPKYKLKVIRVGRAIRASKEVRDRAKKEMGSSIYKKFSKDAVECPVKGKTVSFIECFVCPNYIRRYKGEVHCKGEEFSS